MTIVIRLSPEATPEKHPMAIMFGGVFKGLILFLLTIFFGSVFGGTLFSTTLLVMLFFVAIALSRILSVWIFCWLEKAMELRIIECESSAEMRGMARLLVAMPGVLVESVTHGYRYSGGYRVDVDTSECTEHHTPEAANRGRQFFKGLICCIFVVPAFLSMFVIVTATMLPWGVDLLFPVLIALLSGIFMAAEVSLRLHGQVIDRGSFAGSQEVSSPPGGDIDTEVEEVSHESMNRDKRTGSSHSMV